MTSEPFLRLALVVACTVFVAGVAVAACLLDGWLLLSLPAGVACAVALTLEPVPAKPDAKPLTSRQFRRLAGPK